MLYSSYADKINCVKTFIRVGGSALVICGAGCFSIVEDVMGSVLYTRRTNITVLFEGNVRYYQGSVDVGGSMIIIMSSVDMGTAMAGRIGAELAVFNSESVSRRGHPTGGGVL
jgi:hypothetical protein